MLARIWRYIRALFLGKLDQMENPEILLEQAAREMRENLAANRQRAISAITQRNNLKALLDEQQKRASQLEAQAEAALRKGDRDLARRLLREKLTLDETNRQTRASYEQAVEAAEAVKLAIRRQEEVVRQKTAEALAKKAQWKQAQIQIEIDKALRGLTIEEESSAWERASEKIKTAQAEASARAELAEASIQAKIAELEDQNIDVEADKALLELEQRIGVAPADEPGATRTKQAESTPINEVERELVDLEARISDEIEPEIKQE